MVEARLAALDGDLDSAVAHLQKGAALEDDFEYMEPPRFFQVLSVASAFRLPASLDCQ